jgi:hypothetical protein
MEFGGESGADIFRSQKGGRLSHKLQIGFGWVYLLGVDYCGHRTALA